MYHDDINDTVLLNYLVIKALQSYIIILCNRKPKENHVHFSIHTIRYIRENNGNSDSVTVNIFNINLNYFR